MHWDIRTPAIETEGMAMGRKRQGFSLVELLVCVAIISILMAMYLPALSKARKLAEGVVVKEGIRQEVIAGHADAANAAFYQGTSFATDDNTLRTAARTEFRRNLTMSGRNTIVTHLIAQVKNENEFRAYWNTLVNPAAIGTIERNGLGIVARDEAGNKYLLQPTGEIPVSGATFAIGWEFLSTDMAESTAGTLGTTVLYSDGHVDYVPYPTAYPACPSVAELSHRFVTGAP